MKLFILVVFWLQIFSFAVRILDMAASTWPKPQKPKSLGTVLAETILGMAMAVWAAIVLWII